MIGDRIDTNHLDVAISGSGAVELSGRATAQILTLSGLGSVKFTQLKGKTGRISINGNGNGAAQVSVSDTLDVNISGQGTVEYAGNPTIQQTSNGLGRLAKISE